MIKCSIDVFVVVEVVATRTVSEKISYINN